MNINGRPEHTDEQYHTWLDEMTPFLKIGNSLYFAIEKAMLLKHKDSIYRKYRLQDWFCEKIEAYQRYPGEIVNSIFVRLVHSVDEKIHQGITVSNEDWRNLRFFAEKHRSCQHYFISRQEFVQKNTSEDIQKIIDSLEIPSPTSDYDEIAKQAKIELQKNISCAVYK